MKDKTKTPPTIDKTIVSKMISLLDWCYRLGVEAAHALQDEGLAREFLERTKEPGVYGFLSDEPVYITWKEWTLRLMAESRSTCWNGSMMRFFNRMGAFGANYLSAFLPISQVFLNKGVEDYLKSPNAADFSMFNSKNRIWWTEKGLRSISNREWVDTLQLISFDLERRDGAIWESQTPTQAKKIALKPSQYEIFRRCVGVVMLRNNRD